MIHPRMSGASIRARVFGRGCQIRLIHVIKKQMVLLEALTLRIALQQYMGPHVRAYSVFPASVDFAPVQTIVSFSCISETSDESLKKLHRLSYVIFAK